MAIWVTTDLHGNYNLWEQIKNFLKEDDTLIFLGDAIDRGSRGFEIFKEMLEHDQIVYICGNHEDMMYNAFSKGGPEGAAAYKHWMENGGMATINNIKNIGISVEEKFELINKIHNLPTYAEYDSDENGLHFILCHAGYAPGECFDELSQQEQRNKRLWDRSHFHFRWPMEEYDNTIIVHGHTPILLQKHYGQNYNFTGMSPAWYEGNHKVNLDAATAHTGIAFLFNLDTLDYELFVANPDYVEDENERKR